MRVRTRVVLNAFALSTADHGITGAAAGSGVRAALGAIAVLPWA
jgi:hypothetical protein